MLISKVKDNLSAMLHGGSLDKVRNQYEMMERVANTVLTKIDPVETMRLQPLTNTVHSDVYNYSLPSDYKKIIDLMPQAERGQSEKGRRVSAKYFDLRKSFADKRISIEGEGGSKYMRIDWDVEQPVTVHTMNDYDDNGTWSAYGTTTNIKQDTITKYSGSGSVRFDLNADDDGIQINDMDEVDLSDEDETGDFFLWFYIKNSTDLANLNGVTFRWGNTLTTNYWDGVQQTTQADGTSFKVGGNLVRIPWSTATEAGTVDPETIGPLRIIFDIDEAISDIRVDNIICSNGEAFDIKYYSKYLFQDSSGTWISVPTDDTDSVILDNDAVQIYLMELLIAAAQQIEGSDSTFDINYAKNELDGLYRKYKKEHPSQALNLIQYYGGKPARGRWPAGHRYYY